MPPTWRSSRSCRTGSASWSSCSIAFIVIPLTGSDFLLNAVLIPFLIFRAGGDRAQSAHRLYRAAFARHRRLHGGRRLCLPEADDDLPAREHHRLDSRFGIFLGRRRRAVRSAVAAHQGLLSRGGDAGGAVLPRMVLHPHSLALQLQRLGRDRGAVAHDVRHSGHRPDGDLADALSRSCSPSSW